MDSTISKILALIMLIGGTYLCNQSVNILLDNSGALYVFVFALSVLMLRCGLCAIWKGKISC